MFAQQLRQIGFGVLLEFTDPCTYVFERLLQNRVLVGEAEVFKGLVDSGNLFEHAVEAFDTFDCRPGTVLQHQFLRGLYDQVGGIEQALERRRLLWAGSAKGTKTIVSWPIHLMLVSL